MFFHVTFIIFFNTVLIYFPTLESFKVPGTVTTPSNAIFLVYGSSWGEIDTLVVPSYPLCKKPKPEPSVSLIVSSFLWVEKREQMSSLAVVIRQIIYKTTCSVNFLGSSSTDILDSSYNAKFVPSPAVLQWGKTLISKRNEGKTFYYQKSNKFTCYWMQTNSKTTELIEGQIVKVTWDYQGKILSPFALPSCNPFMGYHCSTNIGLTLLFPKTFQKAKCALEIRSQSPGVLTYFSNTSSLTQLSMDQIKRLVWLPPASEFPDLSPVCTLNYHFVYQTPDGYMISMTQNETDPIILSNLALPESDQLNFTQLRSELDKKYPEDPWHPITYSGNTSSSDLLKPRRKRNTLSISPLNQSNSENTSQLDYFFHHFHMEPVEWSPTQQIQLRNRNYLLPAFLENQYETTTHEPGKIEIKWNHSYSDHKVSKRSISPQTLGSQFKYPNKEHEFFQKLDVLTGDHPDHVKARKILLKSGIPTDWIAELSFSKAEMQWGLTKLQTLNREEMLELAYKICELQQQQWTTAWELRTDHPNILAAYITKNPVVTATWKNQKLMADKGVYVDPSIVRFDSLICNGYWKVAVFIEDEWREGWLESASGRINMNLKEKQLGNCSISISSFVIPLQNGNYIDIFSGIQHSGLGIVDLTTDSVAFSFLGAPLMSYSDFSKMMSSQTPPFIKFDPFPPTLDDVEESPTVSFGRTIGEGVSSFGKALYSGVDDYIITPIWNSIKWTIFIVFGFLILVIIVLRMTKSNPSGVIALPVRG